MRQPHVIAAIVCVAFAGCFAPNVKDGAFTCGPGGLCPEGTSCSPVDNRCHAAPLTLTGGGLDASDMALAHGDLATRAGDLGGVVAVHDMAGAPPPDMTPTGPWVGSGMLGDLDLSKVSGSVHCNTETGEIIVDSSNVSVVHGGQAGFDHVAQSAGPAVAVWNFRNVTIPAGVVLKPASASVSVPVFAATGTMSIAGTIDWSGYGGLGGAAGQAGGSRQTGVSSGGLGAFGTDGSGGGGGGHAAMGSPGLGVAPGTGGAAYGTMDLKRVYFGSGGGGGGNATGGLGGNGGGAVVLLGQAITLAGRIDVSALVGSDGGSGVAGGGGGGSGGSLLVGGGSVLLDTGHTLAADGAHGGMPGAGGGYKGGDGAVGRVYIATPMLAVTGGTTPNCTPQAIVSTSPIAIFPR